MRPYYEQDGVTIYHADCRAVEIPVRKVDVVVTDPPYGATSLAWDKPVLQWPALHILKPAAALWVFGSLRSLFGLWPDLVDGGWRFAQDLVWEKHNGSSFHADRFRRVHELVAQFYRGSWDELYRDPQKTMDATGRVVRAKSRPPHTGHIERKPFTSYDGGPRLMRSVLRVRSAHRAAQHPTQKPTGIVAPLIRYSCPPDGCVLDPFMGAGTTLVAAKASGRRAIGVEIQERYCEIAARRLSQGNLALSVPEGT